MPAIYTFEESAVLNRIQPDLIVAATMNDPIFKKFPIRYKNAAKLRWGIKDNVKGLMNLRGIGGEPTSIARTADNFYEANPGYYGQFGTIDEIEMVNRSAGIPAAMDVPVDVQDLVDEIQEDLSILEANRMKQIAWLLAVYGTFAVPLPGGGIGHTETYTNQTLTVPVAWSNLSGSFPLGDLRGLQPQFGRGTSNLFNVNGAEAWMNSKTSNYLLANSNPADLGGKRVENGSTLNDIAADNRLLLTQGAPQVMTWDDGYPDASGTFQLYIPDGKVVVFGARANGELPGEFQITRNAVNDDNGPAPYAFVDDRSKGDKKTVPPKIDVHAGFNGGPVVERPSQIVVLTVA